ncbi:MAG: ABC transporter ATP-binding protein [Chloroflexi bacterium]|nr:ABC transporter ATP-binding protein [Chloroflexota bacterium]MCY3583886.1 ABC transporter ATP-binding protein [Chloroflexota bacterium]MCY3716480.1 ABC transporter ATP-binding protein [Chloroflexota bacterium]MDE2649473.1 ABC transporter ATP-binding protein [Chloroflexota bacterium]MXV92400.1 ABC transporter ATP-binding protein [Chloroflexota bacterium]
MNAIEAQGIHKVFNPGTDEEVIALQDIDLQVVAGEFLSLVGPSGCGKSTLMRLIADLLQPSGGELRVNGKAPAQARRDRDYGMVFQQATLYDWRSVSKNVQLPLEVMGYAKAERVKRAQAMLELVELGDFLEHYPWQLSGGMQQRVSIARALVFEPSVLLMDEPFGALDEFTRERMNMELLRIWQATGTTVVFVTHSIAEAAFLSQRIVVMTPRPGRITQVVANPLPYPRDFQTRADPAFHALVTQLRDLLRDAVGASDNPRKA